MSGVRAPSSVRLVLGFAVLPLVQGGVAYLLWPLVWWMAGHGAARPWDQDNDARRFALLTVVLGVPLIVVGAVPVVYWLRRQGRLRAAYLLLAGVIIGNAPFASYVGGLVVPATLMHLRMGTLSQHLMPVSSLIAGTARAVAIGSFFGLLSAGVFWLVAVCGSHPDYGE